MSHHANRQPNPKALAVLSELRGRIKGDVRADLLSRTLYATDASIYEMIPEAVIMPRCTNDVVATVRACLKHDIPLTARGAGTGLAGGAVNHGIQLDCSRHLDRILDIDIPAQTARVEPGVVLDELNAVLAPHKLHFAPDVATSSRATIGGMIANNSCGAHSIYYGRTVDHLIGVDAVLSDGSVCHWGIDGDTRDGPLAGRCEQALRDVVRGDADEIASRYPKILRRNGGYALDRLRVQNGRINPETILCGSEGTLAIIVGATLRLTPLPRYRGLVVAHFADLMESLTATPLVLKHQPAAVELLDAMVLDAARRHPAMARQGDCIEGYPAAILIIEIFDDDLEPLKHRLSNVMRDLQSRSLGYAWLILTNTAQQQDIWDIRKAGLGLLMSRPGDHQPYAFVEDSAVDPSRLRDYIERFAEIIEQEHVPQAGYYAHASVGCLHVRPVLNLKNHADVLRMRRIADRVSSLALEFGGSMTAEHGDGLLRSCWLEKMYGPRIIDAFAKIKRTFDPHGILNPGKIVSPHPMTEHLRYGPTFAPSPETQQVDTTLDFAAHGGMLGLASMCSGVGQCRQRLVGTMCPSYMVTAEEKHSTRGRANALRVALSNRGLLDGLSDPALEEVMDMCLSCKACKTECPTGVDMARLKAEWLWQKHRREGVPLRSRMIARIAEFARIGSRFPRWANAILQSSWARNLMHRGLGLDRRMPAPILATQSFRHWFKSHKQNVATDTSSKKTRVVYFVDTWTQYFTPQVGIATVRVLEALGHEVVVPPTVCCGRPAISQGLLDHAGRLARQNVDILASSAEAGLPIVGSEPSCLLTLVDEMPQLVRTAEARRIASAAMTIESFIAKALRENPDALRYHKPARPVLYHGHCHQKALLGTDDAMHVLVAASGGMAEETNSGCCGMAGVFGHEVEHYDIAQSIGRQRLFPAIRSRGEADVLVSGFSCRHQIEHHAGVQPKHVMEWLAEFIV